MTTTKLACRTEKQKENNPNNKEHPQKNKGGGGDMMRCQVMCVIHDKNELHANECTLKPGLGEMIIIICG